MQNALLIDDSTAIHALVRAHLGRDFKLASAYEGRTGFEQAASLTPEFILLDVDLPDIDGFEVCRMLKDNPATKAVPVIFLTSMTSRQQKISGLDCGACDYVTKPFEPAELRARVRAAVRVKHTCDEVVQEALIDRTTGLFNHRYLETRLEGELARARRAGHLLACIMVSLDGLKKSDSHAPDLTRDAALYSIGRAVLQACRKEDVACRFSEDTFAILAIGTNAESVQALARRIQFIVQSCDPFDADTPTMLSVSIGIALSRFSTGMSIVYEASDALAKAKAVSDGRIVIGSELLELHLAG
jgi:two-component system, cell cycle response regulator